jgi:hypothetical protein
MIDKETRRTLTGQRRTRRRRRKLDHKPRHGGRFLDRGTSKERRAEPRAGPLRFPTSRTTNAHRSLGRIYDRHHENTLRGAMPTRGMFPCRDACLSQGRDDGSPAEGHAVRTPAAGRPGLVPGQTATVPAWRRVGSPRSARSPSHVISDERVTARRNAPPCPSEASRMGPSAERRAIATTRPRGRGAGKRSASFMPKLNDASPTRRGASRDERGASDTDLIGTGRDGLDRGPARQLNHDERLRRRFDP